MENHNNQDPRERFLEILKKTFGEYELNGYVYQFRNYDQKDIAIAIGADPSSLNRLLNVNELKGQNTFERYSIMADNYAKAKQFDSLKNQNKFAKKKRYNLRSLSIFTLILLAITGTWIADHAYLKSSVEEMKQNHYITYDDIAETVRTITSANAPKLAQIAIIQNLKSKQNSIIDTFAIIKECRIQIESTVRASRINRFNKQIILPNGQKLVDVLEQLYPSENLHACNDSILAYAKVIPDSAKIFDRMLMESRGALLSKEIDLNELIRLVERNVNYVQDVEISKIEKIINTGYSSM